MKESIYNGKQDGRTIINRWCAERKKEKKKKSEL